MDVYLYGLIIIVFILSIFCQWNVSETFSKYKKRKNSQNIPAYQVARTILDKNGLFDVSIQRIDGKLTDHFDPRTNTVCLSEAVYDSASIGAAGIAAHECGHAVQHNTQYAPIVMRTAIFPVVNIAQHTWFWLFLIGMFIQWSGLITLGIILFACVTLFQVITLPVELDASDRAMKALSDYEILRFDELRGARKVLTAAAMTYIAALAMSILQLLRLLLNARR